MCALNDPFDVCEFCLRKIDDNMCMFVYSNVNGGRLVHLILAGGNVESEHS